MSLHNLLFILGSLAIIPFWALMILAPRWHWTERVMNAWWPVIVVAVLYVLSLLSTAGLIPPLYLMERGLGGEVFQSAPPTPDLNGVATLLGDPPGAATAWLHMLAFDLFVGRWAYLDSRTRPIPTWIVSIALFFILLTGPFGLLLYLAARRRWRGTSFTAYSPSPFDGEGARG